MMIHVAIVSEGGKTDGQLVENVWQFQIIFYWNPANDTRGDEKKNKNPRKFEIRRRGEAFELRVVVRRGIKPRGE